MGSLNLPSASKCYVDTSIVIYTIERFPKYWPALEPMWLNLQRNNFEIFSSELTLLEVLVLPLRNQDAMLISAYEQFLLCSEIQLLPIDRSILKSAAQLRAGTTIRTPDAIHAASALAANCSHFLTNDRALHHLPEISVIVLDEVIEAVKDL